MKLKLIIFSILLSFSWQGVFSQSVTRLGQDLESLNAISTGVPFLLISPDARSGAMGDVGVATSPDANSAHFNASKYAFIEDDFAINISYIPWLRNLVGDINFSNISAHKRIDDRQTVAVSLMYFSLGSIAFRDITGEKIKDYNPNEFATDFSYAIKLHENISGAIALRWIHSNLTGGFSQSGSSPSHSANAFAGDVSAFYTNDIQLGGMDSKLNAGLNISNLGTKLSYSDDAYQEFLPANFKIGSALTLEIDDHNSIMVSADINKLLVPTPQMVIIDENGDEIIGGKDNNVSVPAGVFQSLYDAPYGMSEEMQEVMYSFGAEYWYNNMFALRTGYFHEHENKGNRKYLTFGLGMKMNVFNLDFAYLVPPSGKNNPLANTLRFTIGFNLSGE